jgi:two-component system, OmpR family, alkaline phosphatase synthesis response regulator PhoP
MQTILLVDDEADIREIVSYNLVEAGYEVVEAENGLEAIDILKTKAVDLIILDFMMPLMNGPQTAKYLKEHNINIPFIFFTAKTDEDTEVHTFELGAEDFIPKPIKPKVLLTRIHAILKNAVKTTDKIEIRNLSINKSTYSVFFTEGKEVKLPKKEFELLCYLAAKPNQVHGRQILLDEIWGKDLYVVERTVDVHIRKIREKLGDDLIQTIKGVGYLIATE